MRVLVGEYNYSFSREEYLAELSDKFSDPEAEFEIQLELVMSYALNIATCLIATERE